MISLPGTGQREDWERFQHPCKMSPLPCMNQEQHLANRLAAFSNSRPAQAASSVTAPWDPRPGIRGDGQAAARGRLHRAAAGPRPCEPKKAAPPPARC